MNKTVTVNLGGWVFHIEEEAFSNLTIYVNALKKHFSKMEGSTEIIEDIEARIAEIFKIRLNENREVIVNEDVKFIMSEIGQPEDFDDFSTGENADTGYSKSNSTETSNKKLYRDKEEGILGGVCAGLSAYFDISVIWVRLFFILLTWVGMSFFIYILLWILIPSAKTIQQKMQMRGEPFNLDNLEKNIKTEFEGVKKNVQNFAEKAKKEEWVKDTASTFERLIISFSKLIITIILIFFKFIGVIIGSALLFILAMAAIFLIDKSIFTLLFNNSWWFIIAVTGIGFLLIGLAFSITLSVLRWVFNIGSNNQHQNRSLRNGFMAIVGLGIILCLSVASYTAFEFLDSSQISKTIDITSTSDTLYVDLLDIYDFNNSYNFKVLSGENFDHEAEDLDLLKNIQLNVVPSITKQTQISYIVSSRGGSTANAKTNASNVNYPIHQLDSLLLFGDRFSLDEDATWHNQGISAVIKIPIGKTIYLNSDIGELIFNIDNRHNMHDADMLGHFWKMEAEGLSCLDCDEHEFDPVTRKEINKINEHIDIDIDDHSIKLHID